MNLTSLASSAFDTARSTFKAMAEAAVPPAEDGANGRSGPAASSGGGPQRDTRGTVADRSAAPRAAAETTGSADGGEQKSPAKGRRRGTVLDSYA